MLLLYNGVMNSEEFDKLFKYMEKRFDSVEKNFEMVRADIRENSLALGELAGQIRDYHEEMLMMGRKVDRLERWIHQIAKETGVKLEESI